MVGLVFNIPVMAEVVARGDGFVIDSSDVEALKAFFSEKGFESTDAEHLNSALKMRLFVLEARDSGLISSLPVTTGPYKYETVQEYYRLFLVYYQHLMETYPVSEDAIQSYYLSYPDKFMINKEGAKEDGQKQEVSALDDGIKSFIRNKIVFSKKAVIIDDEFKRLKTKYHVIVE
ncbi:MAG: hypothetical protein NTU74_02575 [Deltaproteobacteria bacterium]|nr:hypothetical protein [Deltaproteobacteria bacterium]